MPTVRDSLELDLDARSPSDDGRPLSSVAAVHHERLRLAFQSLDVWNHGTRRPFTFDEAMAVPAIAIAIRIRAREIERRTNQGDNSGQP